MKGEPKASGATRSGATRSGATRSGATRSGLIKTEQLSHRHLPPPPLEELGLSPFTPPGQRPSGDLLPRLKRFRFELLAEYIAQAFEPCRVADVGGGKGLLAWLLQERGFDATVIDPISQRLPEKYKSLAAGKRMRIPPDATVPRRDESFSRAHGSQFDLLVGLHAHGSNVGMLEAVAENGCAALILPCCVIGEPVTPQPGTSWFHCLTARADELALSVDYFHLNFKGQNVGFVARRGP